MADREMTNEEAIEILGGIRACYIIFDEYDEPKYAALSKAIQALKAEPIVRCRDCVDWVRNYTDRAKGRGKRMTLNGAIKQLHELRSEEDMPVYYRLAIAEVINVLLMDAQEVRHGRWEVVDETEPRRYGCSNCKRLSWSETNYCPNCGAKMDLKEENE